jgi:threonine dehydrogenase-like Zn-dependent dehydrogenase
MKSIAVIPGERDVKLIERHAPKLRCPRDVKLRILEVGVCGTDLEICSFQYGTPPAGFDYLVIGHESLGEVVEVGRTVKGLKPGDLVVSMVRRPCVHERHRP